MLVMVERNKAAATDTAIEAVQEEHGDARRLPAAQVPAIESLRISPPGAAAVLVNISQRGLLAECPNALRPGMSVTVTFSGRFTPSTVRGRVARTAVADMTENGIRYHIGVAFDEPLPPLVTSAAAPPPAAPVPIADATPLARVSPPPRVNRW